MSCLQPSFPPRPLPCLWPAQCGSFRGSPSDSAPTKPPALLGGGGKRGGLGGSVWGHLPPMTLSPLCPLLSWEQDNVTAPGSAIFSGPLAVSSGKRSPISDLRSPERSHRLSLSGERGWETAAQVPVLHTFPTGPCHEASLSLGTFASLSLFPRHSHKMLSMEPGLALDRCPSLALFASASS